MKFIDRTLGLASLSWVVQATFGCTVFWALLIAVMLMEEEETSNSIRLRDLNSLERDPPETPA